MKLTNGEIFKWRESYFLPVGGFWQLNRSGLAIEKIDETKLAEIYIYIYIYIYVCMSETTSFHSYIRKKNAISVIETSKFQTPRPNFHSPLSLYLKTLNPSTASLQFAMVFLNQNWCHFVSFLFSFNFDLPPPQTRR